MPEQVHVKLYCNMQQAAWINCDGSMTNQKVQGMLVLSTPNSCKGEHFRSLQSKDIMLSSTYVCNDQPFLVSRLVEVQSTQ